jgi:hypothetical protein
VGGTLGVTGATTLSSFSASGAASLTSLSVSSDATVAGTLGVTGATTLSSLSTTGAASLTSLGVTNNATVGGTLGVTGLTTTNGVTNTGNISTTTLSTTGAATLGSAAITNNATVGGTLGVTGATTLSTLTTTGAATLQSVAVGSGGLAVAPSAPVNMGGNRVQNVATPIDPTDAANKAYVDAMSGNVGNLQAAIDAQTARINAAFRQIDRNTEGVAIALAMAGLALPDTKVFAISGGMGFFDNKQAFAAQTALRINDVLVLNGGVGLGMESNQVGGRFGVMAAW